MGTAKKVSAAKKAAPKKAADAVTPATEGRPGIDVHEHVPADNPKALKRTSPGKPAAPRTDSDIDPGAPFTEALGVGDDRAVALTIEDATDAGLFGYEVDGTPNENYTVRGVGRRLPTPETVAP